MLMVTMKHGGKWDLLGSVLKGKGPTFERPVTGILNIIIDNIYHNHVDRLGMKYFISQLESDRTLFKNYPYALYATDETFLTANRPTGTHQESKKYFSNKHKMYGYKTDVSVVPNSIALACSAHDPGSVSDITMFRKMDGFHRDATTKQGHDCSAPDHGPMRTPYLLNWAIITEKDYQGAADSLRVLYFKKKPPHGRLTLGEERSNAELASDRLIVEIYFGRQCTFWTIIGSTFKWSESCYDSIFQFTVALTN